MALEPDFCIVYTAQCSVHKFQDKTNWGAPEEERNNRAHVLIAAHVAQDGTETFTTVDSTPYLEKIEYDINNGKDGHYMYELLRFSIYNVAIGYTPELLDINGEIASYAALVYYPPLDKFYKCIGGNAGVPPDAVDGSTYWEEITDFTVDSIRESDKIIIYRWDDIFTCRTRKCVREELIAIGCMCEDMSKFMKYFKKKTMLDGAYALSDNQEHSKAEANIRLLENMCPKC